MERGSFNSGSGVHFPDQEEPVLSLGLVEGHQETARHGAGYLPIPVLSDNLPALHHLETLEAREHPEFVVRAKRVPVLHPEDRGEAPGQGPEVLPTPGDLGEGRLGDHAGADQAEPNPRFG